MSLEAITRALSAAPGVAAWHVCERVLTSHQRYRVFKAVEAERSAHMRTVQITLHTAGTRDGQPVIGEATITLTGDATEIPAQRLREAVAQASLVANPAYTLPGQAEVPNMALADPDIVADPWAVIADLTAQMDAGAGAIPICASELFADVQTFAVVTSGGFSGSYTGTELFAEFVLLAEDGKHSVECHGMRRARRPAELELAPALARHAGWTADRLEATLPPTATLPVVFGEEALDSLFDTFVAHAGGRARFEGWSRLAEGKPLIADLTGETLSIAVDATLPWRLSSRPFDVEGQVNHRVDIVRDGRFERRVASKRYADYLGIAATGSGGSVVVATGATPLAELLTGGPVLHALRFSTFHPNPVTGAFSGELRTAYLMRADGKVTPVCGGSVSGNVWEAFRNARLSRERTVRPGYDGPAGVRLHGVTVAGGA